MPGSRRASDLLRRERGAVAIIVAASMLALIGLILLAVQVGMIGTVRALLQGSADQAALAGAGQLDGTSDGLTQADAEATKILAGGKNFPSKLNEGSDLSIAGDAFATGIWDLQKPELGFTPSGDPEIVNAVRVRGRKTGALNGSVEMFLGGSLGPNDVELSRTGIAALGSCANLPCGPDLPIAVCENEIHCGQKVRLLQSPSPTDTAAWTGFADNNTNANQLRSFIRNCDSIPDVRVGDCISLNNGQVSSAQRELLDRFEKWQSDNSCPNVRVPDTDNIGCDPETCGPMTAGDQVDINGDSIVDEEDCGMMVILPLVPCSEEIDNACAGGTTDAGMNQFRQLSGFVVMVITEVKSQGNPKYVDGYPLCGVHVPGTSTGPGPNCSPSSPVCCATQPVLVNKNLRS